MNMQQLLDFASDQIDAILAKRQPAHEGNSETATKVIASDLQLSKQIIKSTKKDPSTIYDNLISHLNGILNGDAMQYSVSVEKSEPTPVRRGKTPAQSKQPIVTLKETPIGKDVRELVNDLLIKKKSVVLVSDEAATKSESGKIENSVNGSTLSTASVKSEQSAKSTIDYIALIRNVLIKATVEISDSKKVEVNKNSVKFSAKGNASKFIDQLKTYGINKSVPASAKAPYIVTMSDDELEILNKAINSYSANEPVTTTPAAPQTHTAPIVTTTAPAGTIPPTPAAPVAPAVKVEEPAKSTQQSNNELMMQQLLQQMMLSNQNHQEAIATNKQLQEQVKTLADNNKNLSHKMEQLSSEVQETRRTAEAANNNLMALTEGICNLVSRPAIAAAITNDPEALTMANRLIGHAPENMRPNLLEYKQDKPQYDDLPAKYTFASEPKDKNTKDYNYNKLNKCLSDMRVFVLRELMGFHDGLNNANGNTLSTSSMGTFSAGNVTPVKECAALLIYKIIRNPEKEMNELAIILSQTCNEAKLANDQNTQKLNDLLSSFTKLKYSDNPKIKKELGEYYQTMATFYDSKGRAESAKIVPDNSTFKNELIQAKDQTSAPSKRK